LLNNEKRWTSRRRRLEYGEDAKTVVLYMSYKHSRYLSIMKRSMGKVGFRAFLESMIERCWGEYMQKEQETYERVRQRSSATTGSTLSPSLDHRQMDS
jgi:hypothetical protein